jgi:hypothetical protein
MKSIPTSSSIPLIFVFTILALVLVLILTFKVEQAKKKTGVSFVYLLFAGIFIGLVGLRAVALNNPFYLYMVILFWSLLAGIIHVLISDRVLVWTKSTAFGWRIMYAIALIFSGIAAMMGFMQLMGYDFMILYNLSATLTFLIPLTLIFSIDCYLQIPQKVFIQQKPWIYYRSSDLQFKSDEISHFFIIKYHLTSQTGGEVIESLPMRAPGNIKLGDYFNSTLEVNKVSQGRYSVEVRDRTNNSYGWFFFLSDRSNQEKMLDPNKTFLELGFTNPVYFGDSNPEVIETITRQAEREGKFFLITCKREPEYKSQLTKS